MTKYKYGNPEAPIVLIQPVGDHDLPEIEGEVAQIRKLTALDFQMIAVKVDDWNLDLSPWRSPAVFGKEDFGDGAASLLEEILRLCSDESKTYYLGGYSLAGLFSLWASYQTDRFAGIAAHRGEPPRHRTRARRGLCARVRPDGRQPRFCRRTGNSDPARCGRARFHGGGCRAHAADGLSSHARHALRHAPPGAAGCGGPVR